MNNNPLIFLGAMANSALYFGAVFVAGLVAHNLKAEYLDIAAIGVTYLSYMLQAFATTRLCQAVVGLSVAMGAAAGVALLV